MPKKLTPAEQAIVVKASQDLYRYEKTCEEHSAVLRRDLTSIVYQEYTANSNPMGFMPPRNEFERYIEESEKVLEKECGTTLDHLHVVHSAYFLCRLLMRKVSEHGEHVYLEFIRRKVELDKQYPYVFPESPSESAAIQVPAPSDYPASVAARAFRSKEVMNLPRVLLQETELIRYKRQPELLQSDTFVTFNEDEAEYEAFRVPAFITADHERFFYVMYADEGPEALACTSMDLFELLRTSERVLN